jgi:hypothetical protein
VCAGLEQKGVCKAPCGSYSLACNNRVGAGRQQLMPRYSLQDDAGCCAQSTALQFVLGNKGGAQPPCSPHAPALVPRHG